MTTHAGERAELIRELRRIGPKCMDAAEHLGLTVITLPELPPPMTFSLMPSECVLIAESGSDFSVWAGIALFMALELGLEVDHATLFDVAVAMDRRSGIFLARDIA